MKNSHWVPAGGKNDSLSRRGFTLIESLVTIVVLATLGSVTSLILMSSIDGYSAAATQSQLHAETSIAFEQIARELHNIGPDPEDGGPSPNITSLSETEITYSGTHQISFSNGQLLFSPNGGPAALLLEDITDFAFTAYDEENTPLPAPLSGEQTNDIRRVEVEVTITRNGISESLRTRVFLRSTLAVSGGGEL